MPINRGPFNALVDDSGNGLTGSIWNKAAIASVILDPADAAYAAAPIYGSFNLNDASGAGLTLSNTLSFYLKIGKLVFITGQPVYPATGDTASATLGGLPFPAANLNPPGGGVSNWGHPKGFYIPANSTIMLLTSPATGSSLRNVDCSSTNTVFIAVYESLT
jgi:hypothetical protein